MEYLRQVYIIFILYYLLLVRVSSMLYCGVLAHISVRTSVCVCTSIAIWWGWGASIIRVYTDKRLRQYGDSFPLASTSFNLNQDLWRSWSEYCIPPLCMKTATPRAVLQVALAACGPLYVCMYELTGPLGAVHQHHRLNTSVPSKGGQPACHSTLALTWSHGARWQLSKADNVPRTAWFA